MDARWDIIQSLGIKLLSIKVPLVWRDQTSKSVDMIIITVYNQPFYDSTVGTNNKNIYVNYVDIFLESDQVFPMHLL